MYFNIKKFTKKSLSHDKSCSFKKLIVLVCWELDWPSWWYICSIWRFPTLLNIRMKECDKGNESFRVNFALFRNFTNQKQRKGKKKWSRIESEIYWLGVPRYKKKYNFNHIINRNIEPAFPDQNTQKFKREKLEQNTSLNSLISWIFTNWIVN